MFDQERFQGTARLYGEQLTNRLAQTRVLVIGIGGVGSWVAEALARTAIGHVSLLDMDDICISNSNRQLPALSGNIGRTKVEAMAERLRLISPEAVVEPLFDFLSASNFDQYLQPAPDYVIDCIDSVAVKVALIAYCRRHKIPLVTTGGAGGKTDPTRIRVCDLSQTIQDPLAAKVRSKLRQDHQFPRQGKKMSIDIVSSDQPLRYPDAQGEFCLNKPPTAGPMRLDCAQGFGASMMVTASFGMAAVAQMLARLEARPPRAT